ncbi:polyprenyl synthetase family protein [Lactobacillus hominis]|uniref:Possible trans-hexaprenyltranstransferase n=1 Tax=Lactobacillus hominis DSM 23910 = CRBIP 24.179 TaxID=1423758 RepID=I7KGD9_9LACO|nr:polyprenyl synthetase family protein [Lactobacillus hominis]CCI81180.1 Possible trans-hexaprenyltranstransferase [Lactobacillus hominis DSM 23910 = CRBIP 24.179]
MKNKFAFWDEFPEIQKDVMTVNKIILSHVKNMRGTLGDALWDTFDVPGKMLRPGFVMLFGQFGPKAKENHQELLNIATSIETLHNATLIHDDIIDESDTRHGKKSIQAKYGKHIAVYAGDYLFAISLTLLSDNTKSLGTVKVDGETMQDILIGETEQYNNAYNDQISEKQYLNQIKGKTGVLFGLSCFIGAYESGIKATQAVKARKFGEYLGQAFQLKDDILDYTSSAEAFKKPVLLDVKDGVYSGPLIFALQKDKDGRLHELLKFGKDLSQEQLLEIDKLVNNYGGVERAQKLADEYTQKALNSLRKNWPDNETRAQIEKLTKKLLGRKY